MKFREWLNENNIHFASWIKDGTVVVYIDNKRYSYQIDAIHHDRLRKLARFKPFTALNHIKKLAEKDQEVLSQNLSQDSPKTPKDTSKTSFVQGNLMF
jgi:hypothetical protein